MTLDEMEALGQKASKIKSALAQLNKARTVLREINQHVKRKQVWEPNFQIKPRTDTWPTEEITVKIRVPGGYLQQWAVDAVRRAEREVVAAGGIVPPAEK